MIMNFEQWWKDNAHKFPQADHSADGHEEVAAAAWNSAVKAAAEIADRHFIYGHSVAGPEFAKAGADVIRKLKHSFR
jgi:hypothetical protein